MHCKTAWLEWGPKSHFQSTITIYICKVQKMFFCFVLFLLLFFIFKKKDLPWNSWLQVCWVVSAVCWVPTVHLQTTFGVVWEHLHLEQQQTLQALEASVFSNLHQPFCCSKLQKHKKTNVWMIIQKWDYVWKNWFVFWDSLCFWKNKVSRNVWFIDFDVSVTFFNDNNSFHLCRFPEFSKFSSIFLMFKFSFFFQ